MPQAVTADTTAKPFQQYTSGRFGNISPRSCLPLWATQYTYWC